MKKKILRKNKDDKNLSFFKTFFLSLFLILIFAALPNSINFVKKSFKSNEIVINSSKQNFDEIFDKQKKNKFIEGNASERFSWNIFEDIDVFGKDEEDKDPQRLSASTIEELFKDNGYNLDKVKETKLVNAGNQLTRLPKELKNIGQKKKNYLFK